jgi:type VI protein secretion system component VasF
MTTDLARSAPEPKSHNTIWRYETEGMAELRQKLTKAGHSPEVIDAFKACLITLEGHGLRLS